MRINKRQIKKEWLSVIAVVEKMKRPVNYPEGMQ
jgi:hypothetical protein